MKTYKKKNGPRYLSIRINWNSPDKGYATLTGPRVQKYILNNIKKGYNLFQTVPHTYFNVYGTTTIRLQAVKYNSWKKIKWNKIRCTRRRDKIQTSPCDIGSDHYKFFFKLKGNSKVAGFGSYLMGLFSGSITLQAHKEAVSEMKKTFGKLNVYIHNMELDWFHIKEKII